MKAKLLVIALTIISQLVRAQRGELANAKINYDKFAGLKELNTKFLDITSLKNAQSSIDKAAIHERTATDPSTWAYKALIYADLSLLDSVATKVDPLVGEASDALKKAIELNNGNQANQLTIDRARLLLSQCELNRGARSYRSADYKNAYTAFNQALIYKPGDTTLTYYAGLAAANAKNYKAAIQNYDQLIKTNFSSNRQIYLDLSRMYAMEGDTTSAIRLASEGSNKYADDVALATQEIELSLMSGREKEIIAKTAAQAQKNPKNKLYPFYLGIAYSTIKDFDRAEEAYKKAIVIDPKYADAHTNLGGLLLNKGIDIYNTANKLPQNKQKEYDEMMQRANSQFEVAFLYLQKAVELDPSSRIALEGLKKYYFIKKNKPKEEEMSKKLNALK